MRILVLSGGGAKGFAFLGVLKALEEYGMKPDMIVGVSVGALVGIGYSILGSAERLIEFSRKLKEEVGFSFPSPFSRCGIGSFISKIFLSFYVSTFDHFLSLKKPLKRIEDYLKDMKLEDLKLKVVTLSTDLRNGKIVVNEKGPIIDAIVSSISIPGIFPLIRVDDGILCDGGVLDNLPVDIAMGYDPDEIVAVRVVERRMEFDLTTAVGIMQMMDYMRDDKLERHEAEKADLFIDLEIEGIGLLNFKEGVKLIEAGYSKAVEIIENRRN